MGYLELPQVNISQSDYGWDILVYHKYIFSRLHGRVWDGVTLKTFERSLRYDLVT